MSMQLVAGAVNGVPALINVENAGSDPVTIPFADNGVADTLDVDTDGGGLYTPGGSRVAIIGGSTAGRDHFPFAVPDIDAPTVAAWGFWPQAISLDEAMEWFWRIKTWRLTGEFSCDVHIDDGEGNIEDGTITVELTAGGNHILTSSPATREADRVIELGASGGETNEEGITTVPSGDTPIIAFNEASILRVGAGEWMYYSGGQFYPGMWVSLGVAMEGYIVASDNGYTVSIPLGGVRTTASDVSISVNGHSLYLGVSDDSSGLVTVSNINGSFALDPLEYWPYATKAGLPVYDTATGAQLNDPLS